jgi:nucleoside recognition membrane protein YjiH
VRTLLWQQVRLFLLAIFYTAALLAALGLPLSALGWLLSKLMARPDWTFGGSTFVVGFAMMLGSAACFALSLIYQAAATIVREWRKPDA